MAANTTCRVRHRCGHHIDWDLSHKPPDKRLDFAAWLAQRDCNRCWWTKRRNPKRPTRARTPQRRQAQRRAATHAWETAAGMPALQGSDKATAWARRIRRHLLLTTSALLGAGTGPGAEFTVHYVRAARRITTAGWWIDHRNTGPNELQTLLDVSAPEPHTNEDDA